MFRAKRYAFLVIRAPKSCFGTIRTRLDPGGAVTAEDYKYKSQSHGLIRFFLVITSHFFLFSLTKPTLLTKKRSSRRICAPFSRLGQSLRVHGAAAASCKLDLLLTGLKGCLLCSFQFAL